MEFPHPRDLQGLMPVSAPKLFARAPWYTPGAFRDTPLVPEYVLYEYLPDGIPMTPLATDEWARRVVLPDNAIFRRRGSGGGARRVPILTARVDFT